MRKLLYVLPILLLSLSSLQGQNIRRIVEVMPYYLSDQCTNLEEPKRSECAEKALLQFVYANMEFPDDEALLEEEEKIEIRFIVEIDGSLSNFEIIKGRESPSSQIALEASRKIGRFMPAQLNNKSVRTYYQISL